jgi:hypothetical protein
MTDEAIDALGAFMAANAARFIGFEQAAARPWPAALVRPIGQALRLALTAKRRLR